MPASTEEKQKLSGWGPKFFWGLALLGIPASLSSPGATVSMGLVAGYGVYLAFHEGLDADLKRVLKWMAGCYALLLTVDMLNGGFVGNLISTGVNYLPLIALAPYAYALRRVGVSGIVVEKAMKLAVIIATLATVYLLFEGQHRPGGLNLNSVPFSLVVSIWAIMLLSRGLWNFQHGRLSILIGLLALVPVALSESKIALICVLVGSAIIGLLWTVETRQWRVLATVSVAFVAAMVTASYFHAFRRFDELYVILADFLGEGIIRGDSFGQRYQLLVAGMQAFLDRPLLGHGLNERMIAVFSHLGSNEIGTRSLGHLHNDYMTHIVSYGVFGAVFLVAYFVGLWRLVIRPADAGFEWAGVAIVAMLIIYMAADVAFNMDPISGATTIAFGLMLALAKPARRTPDGETTPVPGLQNPPVLN